MKVLGIDTSGYANAIGVVDGDKVLADLNFAARTDSLEKIVAHVDAALQEAHLELKDIEGIGVGLGPGSWTGIRVGVTVGKMLAYSTGKPVAGIPTLEVVAYAAMKSGLPVCAIIGAGTKSTVYAAFYGVSDGVPVRTGDYYVGDVMGLAQLIETPTVLVGAQARYYGDLLLAVNRNLPLEIIEAAPCGATVARMAAERLQRGEKDDTLAIAPLYLKESTAKAYIGRYMRTEANGK